MKIHAFILAFGGLVGAATMANAQTAPASADPLADLQGDFGKIVGEAFHRPDPVIATADPGVGYALRSSIEAPGAVFAGLMQPLRAFDGTPAAGAVVAAPAPRPVRHVRLRRHRMPAQG